jgi:hypothetical protein
MKLMDIQTVDVLDHYNVRLVFSDNVEKVVNLEMYLRGPIFEPIRNNMEVFRTVYVDENAGTIVWPNGADIDPNVLYYDHLQPAWMTDSATAVST